MVGAEWFASMSISKFYGRESNFLGDFKFAFYYY